MIPMYKGYEAKSIGSGSSFHLPAGNYVATIMKGEQKQTTNGNAYLLVSFDIAEGEHKGCFAADYRNSTSDDKKWRGTYKLWIPKGDGTEKDGYAVKRFNNFAGCLEESNEGYHWDWNETKLKGLTIGVMYRNTVKEIDGVIRTWTECGSVASADAVRSGNLKVMKDYVDRSASAPSAVPAAASADDDGDLPF